MAGRDAPGGVPGGAPGDRSGRPSAARSAEPRGLVPLLLYLGMLVAVVSSLGAPLVPAIAEANDVSVASAQWSLTVTLLVGAVATPVIGRLGDGPARRTVVLAVLAVVLLGSVLAALPLGLGWTIAGRALQGLGLGLTPLTIATARTVLAGERSRSTVAALSVTVAAGVGLGYPVTGFIAELGGVHAAFWFGAGAAAGALVAAAVVYPRSVGVPARRLDVLGALLLGLGLAAGLLAVGEGADLGWSSAPVVTLAAVAVLALAAWVRWQLRTPAPLVDLRLARGRRAATAHATALLVGVANYLLLASAPRLAQTPEATGYGFGTSIVVAGLVLLPFSGASVVASQFARWLDRRAGPRAVLPLGAGVLGLGLLLFGLVREDLWQLFLASGVSGLGVGCMFAALPGVIVGAVPVRETGSAMSLNQVLRYIGFSVGSALSAALLEAATPDGAAYPASGGYGAIAVVGCAACVVTAALTAFLPAPPPATAGGAPPADGTAGVGAPRDARTG